MYNRLYGYVYDRVYENVYYRVHRCETSLKDWPGHDKKVARATVAISLRIAAPTAEIPILFSGTVISCWVPQFLPTVILCQQNKYRGGTSDATFLSALIIIIIIIVIVVVGHFKSFQPRKPRFSSFKNNTGPTEKTSH